MTRAYIALGSNIEPEKHLRFGISRLRMVCIVTAISPVIQTPPFGYLEQPDFLDVTVGVETDLSPAAFKQTLIQIESETGRDRASQLTKWGPLTLDMDILLWGDTALEFGEKPWRVPNEGILQHAAVAAPLAAIAPDLTHPVTGETLRAIADRLGTSGFVLRPDVVVT